MVNLTSKGQILVEGDKTETKVTQAGKDDFDKLPDQFVLEGEHPVEGIGFTFVNQGKFIMNGTLLLANGVNMKVRTIAKEDLESQD